MTIIFFCLFMETHTNMLFSETNNNYIKNSTRVKNKYYSETRNLS